MNYLWEWRNLFGDSDDFLLLALDRYGFSLNCDFRIKLPSARLLRWFVLYDLALWFDGMCC
jgi:hypothetical protein